MPTGRLRVFDGSRVAIVDSNFTRAERIGVQCAVMNATRARRWRTSSYPALQNQPCSANSEFEIIRNPLRPSRSIRDVISEIREPVTFGQFRTRLLSAVTARAGSALTTAPAGS